MVARLAGVALWKQFHRAILIYTRSHPRPCLLLQHRQYLKRQRCPLPRRQVSAVKVMAAAGRPDGRPPGPQWLRTLALLELLPRCIVVSVSQNVTVDVFLVLWPGTVERLLEPFGIAGQLFGRLHVGRHGCTLKGTDHGTGDRKSVV